MRISGCGFEEGCEAAKFSGLVIRNPHPAFEETDAGIAG
jgi:hypothetical protein